MTLISQKNRPIILLPVIDGMVKHIFFDLDNTLWDFDKNSECAIKSMFVEHRIKEDFGVEFELFHKNYYQINEALWLQFRDEKISKAELRERRFKQAFLSVHITKLELAEKFEAIYFQEIVKFNYLMAGSEELLDYLKNKYQIHVLSNGFFEVTKRKIETSALINYINTWTSAEEINIRKPRPEIFDHALKKAGAKKDESIYIGDDLIADIKGAQDFGVKSIFYNPSNKAVDNGISSINHLLELKKIF